PSSAATASATWWASPVIMTTRLPSLCSCSTASRDSGRPASSSERPPTTVSSRTTYKTVAPRCFHTPTWSASTSGSATSNWRSTPRPPTAPLGPPPPPALAAPPPRLGQLHLAQQRRPADGHRGALDAGLHATARHGLEVIGPGSGAGAAGPGPRTQTE